MCQITPEEQLEVIRKVTKEVLKSKASARQFLKDAGIVLQEKNATATKIRNRKNNK